jgi:hypothetical protein
VCYECGADYEPGHTYYCADCLRKRRKETPEETAQRKAEIKYHERRVELEQNPTPVFKYAKYGSQEEVNRWAGKVKNWRNMGIVNPPETKEEYDEMVLDLGGICPACRRPPMEIRGRSPWQLHHDHTTGLVVGLVCARCNMGMGQFEDDPDLMMKVIWYMIKDEQN